MENAVTSAAVSALLYGLAPGNRAAEPAVQFARQLLSGNSWKSSSPGSPPLQSVFTHLNGTHAIPPEDAGSSPQERMESLRRQLRQHTEPWTSSEIPRLLRLLEQTVGGLPCHDAADISLYDYQKITAALASCAAGYLAGAGSPGSCLEPKFRDKKACLLYSADFSGIQKFLFTVATKGALPSLRSRSFFLELLMEHYIDELLSACGASRVNLLYAGGGHCYILLPNTPQVLLSITAWNTRFNDWLAGQFGISLFLADGWTGCSGNELMNIPAEQMPYTAMFRRVSAAIARRKLCRYTPNQLRQLNAGQPDAQGRECPVCGRSDHLVEGGRCFWCNLFVELSAKVLDCPVYLVSGRKSGADFALPGFDDTRYICLADEKTARAQIQDGGALIRAYTKNQSFLWLPNAVRLSVGDYAFSRQMAELARNSTGITRLAVCRMDVDNLGHAFVAGFRTPPGGRTQKPDEYLSIARTSAFSRQMSLFFKERISSILRVPKPDGSRLSVAIVYSGGDDVFLVGAWNDVIDAALRIENAFRVFCGGALTISAGISLHDDHFPIRQAAAQSAELEDRAKQMPGKNALALFTPEEEHTYPWKEFREKVLNEKLQLLRDFFRADEQERGNSFLYRLLELLRGAEANRIQLARCAYLLTRMEPREKERQETYRRFSAAMYRWALSPKDRQQLITAIYLYVYTERTAN